MKIQKRYLICKKVSIVRGKNELIERKITLVEEYPYSVTEEEATEILKERPCVYFAVEVLTCQ